MTPLHGGGIGPCAGRPLDTAFCSRVPTNAAMEIENFEAIGQRSEACIFVVLCCPLSSGKRLCA